MQAPHVRVWGDDEDVALVDWGNGARLAPVDEVMGHELDVVKGDATGI